MTATEFKNTILPTYGIMLALAKKYLADTGDAEDAAQDVVYYLWSKHTNLPVPDNPAAFVLSCVRNKCMDILRKRAKSTVLIENGMPTLIEWYEEEDLTNHRLTNLWNTIETLDEDKKSILKKSLSGKSSSQIAKEMNLKEDNVRQILSRTRIKLRTLILKSKNNYDN